MNYTESEIMEYIEEEDAKFIRLAFRDAFGVQKNISIMPSEIHKAFKEGIPINAKAIHNFLFCPPDKVLHKTSLFWSKSILVINSFISC